MTTASQIQKLEQQLDEDLTAWFETNIDATKAYLDGKTDGIAFALAALRGGSAVEELKKSQQRRQAVTRR